MTGILQREFGDFLRKVYPDPPAPGSDQYRQLQDAFFGGALIGYITTEALVVATELRDYQVQADARARSYEARTRNAGPERVN